MLTYFRNNIDDNNDDNNNNENNNHNQINEKSLFYLLY